MVPHPTAPTCFSSMDKASEQQQSNRIDRPPAYRLCPPRWMKGEGPEADAVRNKKFKLIPRIVKGRWVLPDSMGVLQMHGCVGQSRRECLAQKCGLGHSCMHCMHHPGSDCPSAPPAAPAPLQLDCETERGHHPRAAGPEADHPLLPR